MNEILARIEAKIKEQQQLLRTLSMWNEVRIQGIDPDDVLSFGFDESLMTHKDKMEARRKNVFWFKTPITNTHNFVRLKDGMKISLNPPIKNPNLDT